jgi:hypothetical protein
MDGLMFRKARGRPPEMRPTPQPERRLARFESLPRSIALGGPACEGWRGAPQQVVDSRPVKRGKPTRRWTLGHQKIRLLSREGDVQMKVSPSGCPRYLTLPA